MSSESSVGRARHLAFAAAVALQLVLLATVPGNKLLAWSTGTDVTLETRPVDPYDPLAGYYVTFAYAVEEVPRDLRPPVAFGTPIWLELTPGSPAWTLTAVHVTPTRVRADNVLVRGVWHGTRADLPEASRLYIAEAQRDEVDAALREVGGRGLVDLRIGADGTPAVLRLRTRERRAQPAEGAKTDARAAPDQDPQTHWRVFGD